MNDNLIEKIDNLRVPLRVVKVQYAELGVLTVTLDNGSTWRMKEPMDVLLVDQPLDLVNQWVNQHYELLL